MKRRYMRRMLGAKTLALAGLRGHPGIPGPGKGIFGTLTAGGALAS